MFGRLRRHPHHVLVVFACCVSLLAGCAPIVLCTVETEIFPDYSCGRVVRMDARPNPGYPHQRPRLADYFQLPPAELYETYAVQPDKALLAGTFTSYDGIPSDLVRVTPGTNALSGNVFSFRVMDMVLFVLADFDETLTDIVQSQEDGEAALTELLRLVVPELMAVLKAKYGQRYDMSRLEAWLHNDLPAKLRRMYAGAWAIHSAKRSGVTSPGEDYEIYMFLKAEARRDGLELADPGTPDLERENVRRLKEWGTRLAQQLCPPRPGTPGVSADMLAGTAMDELLASLQQAITARHGSINAFIAKMASLVPRAFGTYLTGTAMPFYMLPDTAYRYRLRVPGTVIQTNGVRELNGDIVWNFIDRDLAFTGQSMWARTIFVREPAVFGLGLRGFPANLGDVDQVFGICLSPQGTPREALLEALRESVTIRNTAPLERLAGDTTAADSQAAQAMLRLFDNHRQSMRRTPADASGFQPGPPPPAPGPGQAGQSGQPGNLTQPGQTGSLAQPGQLGQPGTMAQPGQPAMTPGSQPGQQMGQQIGQQPGQPGQAQPGQLQPAQPQSGQMQPGQMQPGQPNPQGFGQPNTQTLQSPTGSPGTSGAQSNGTGGQQPPLPR